MDPGKKKQRGDDIGFRADGYRITRSRYYES